MGVVYRLHQGTTWPIPVKGVLFPEFNLSYTYCILPSPHSCRDRFLKLCLAGSCKPSAAEIVKAKKKCFFPSRGGPKLQWLKSKFQPLSRFSHIM